MGKKDKNKKKGKGAEKTAMKTEKKLATKQKKLLEKLGEADITSIIRNLETEQSQLKQVTESVCPPPSPRSCFSFITHPEKDELILFGGEFFNGAKTFVYNDLYFYNIVKNEWKIVRSPNGPTPRSGHQMVSIARNGGELWLFGGEHASPSQLQYYHYKDLWKMSLPTRTWEKINTRNGPSARSGHRMIASKSRLIVFGGFHDNNQSYQYFNDIHIFSLETYEWLKLEISNVILPLPRSGCCMTATSEGKILIWGGYSKSPTKNGADCGLVHTDMYALVSDKSDSNKYKWTSLKPGGFRPAPRSSVGFTTAPNGKVYCFGGVMDIHEDEEELKGQFGEDLLSLDLSTLKWRQLEVTPNIKKTKDDIPVDVAMETQSNSEAVTVSTVGDFTVTVAGPSSASSTTLKKMPSLFPNRPSKNRPSPRMNPGLCVCKGTLYLFGGLFEEDEKQFTLNDFYSLDLHKLDEWKVIIPNNIKAHEWIDSSESESSDSNSDTDSSDDSDMDTD